MRLGQKVTRLGQKVTRWTKSNDRRLVQLLKEKLSVKEIASKLDRTVYAVVRRALLTHNLTTGTYQKEGEHFTFSCGCSGVLTKESNKFAVYYECPNRGKGITRRPYSDNRWCCRVARIFSGHVASGHPVIASHQEIRKMMEIPDCWTCYKPLIWTFEKGKTPHLDIDHETGKPFGFSHPGCNMHRPEVITAIQLLAQLGYLVMSKSDVLEANL
jgi:hypothetical protein